MSARPIAGNREMTHSASLTPGQKATLLAIARQTVRRRVRGLPESTPPAEDPALADPGAAFVTLTRGGSLRGCIGYVHPVLPLAETVARCAASAATGDPRFAPVTGEELGELDLEISVLSPLRPIGDPDDIQVGIHGLHISKEGRHGVLLPQVAAEFGWDRDTFLRQVCIKAGLPQDAWRRGAEIQVFTVESICDGLPVEPQASAPL
jgi:AmmeMemoRadiSam system protein A